MHTLTRNEAKSTRLHTVATRTDDGHKPSVFDVAEGFEAKLAILLGGNVTAQNTAREQLRRGTKIAKFDRALGQHGLSLASIAWPDED